MCTVTNENETKDVRKMSDLDAQKCVDLLMEYERTLAAPFTQNQLEELFTLREQRREEPIFSWDKEIGKSMEETQRIYRDFSKFLWEQKQRDDGKDVNFTKEELAYLFKRNSWGQAHGWRDYEILTDIEKEIVNKLGLTPEKKTFPKSSEKFDAIDLETLTVIKKAFPEPSDRLKARRDLKLSAAISIKDERIIRIAEAHVDSIFHVLQFGNFFFVGFGDIFNRNAYADELKQMKEEIGIPLEEQFAILLLKMLKYNYFTLEKQKLHPDQIFYLESKARKTMEESESANLSLSEGLSRREEEKQEDALELWNRYLLMTEEEKRIIAELNLTPAQVDLPEDKLRHTFFPLSFMDGFRHIVTQMLSRHRGEADAEINARLRLKMQFVGKPNFTEYTLSSYSNWDNTGHIYVWQDNGNCSEGEQNEEFYYVRYQLPTHSDDTTEDATPELVVKKKKLRPDQIEYMERKCQETIDASNERSKKQEDEDTAEVDSISEPQNSSEE